jgi:cytochrome c-type biogenesis protein CcmH/NrfG
LKLDLKNARTYYNLALALENAIRSHPTTRAQLTALGMIETKLGRVTEAIEISGKYSR